jgi:tRNA U34 5-methylaminomethyl-2-thiouridine-forming methyltransferase MnmC
MQGLSHYSIVETGDGSPSLEFLKSSEAMHNRIGAFSETIFIYGSAMQKSYENWKALNVISVGLGLGYNEIVFASLCLKNQIKNYSLLSFEIDPFLRSSWLEWLEGIPNTLSPAYFKIIELCSVLYNLKTEEIYSFINELYRDQSATLKHKLDLNTSFEKKYNCVLYDPFSSKTNPECWDEEFLIQFFTKACDTNCLISTYAAKGTLNRSLKKLNFVVETPPGYGGKRNRTLAIRALPQNSHL